MYVQSDEPLIYNTAYDKLKNVGKLSGTTYQKSLYLDFLTCDLIAYDYSSLATNFRKKQDAVSTLNNKLAVCEGLSCLYASFLRSQGIKCKVVRSETHAWNEVYDTTTCKWYLVDITYNDMGMLGVYSYSKLWLSDLTADGKNIKTDDRVFR